jgi:hypothetical protein
MTLALVAFLLCFVAGFYLAGRMAGGDKAQNDIMQDVLDDIGLAKRVREDEKKVIEARNKFTRVD